MNPPFLVETTEDMEVRRLEFLDWLNNAPTIQFINEEGTILEVLSPRRGNLSYCKKQRRRYQRVLDRLGAKRYNTIRYPSGRPTTAETQDFLCTLTYDHKDYTIDEANARVSNDLKKLRTYLNRIFGSNFGTITCYESSKSGYPAPHIILRFDKSFLVFYHLSKKTLKRSWRLKNKKLKDLFQSAWRSIGGGWSDIRGIVDNDGDDISSEIGYSFKYLTKAVIKGERIIDNKTQLNTLANNKAFHRGTVYVSPAFIKRTPNPVISRLDITRTKLQQAKNIYYTLKRKISDNPALQTTLATRISHIQHIISVLKSNLPPPEWQYHQTIEAWRMKLREKDLAYVKIL